MGGVPKQVEDHQSTPFADNSIKCTKQWIVTDLVWAVQGQDGLGEAGAGVSSL